MFQLSDEILISEEQITKRIEEISAEINAHQNGKPIVVVGILKGCFVFIADLVRKLTCPVEVEFIRVVMKDVNDETMTREIQYDAPFSVEGKDLLIVEDILDTGITIDYLSDHFMQKNPASLKVCVLLDKVDSHKVDLKIDYTGFEIPNKFVVGYGLDFEEKYRELPYITHVEGVSWPLADKK